MIPVEANLPCRIAVSPRHFSWNSPPPPPSSPLSEEGSDLTIGTAPVLQTGLVLRAIVRL